MKILEKTSRESVYVALARTKNEDIPLVKCVEDLLRSKSARMFSVLNEDVVIPFSGGVDSLAAALVCLTEMCRIHPVFIDRGQRNLQYERQSALELYGILSRQFRSQVGKWFEMKLETPPK